MSRIAKQPIVIPKGTEVAISGSEMRVKGPKGELVRAFRTADVAIAIEGEQVVVTPKRNTRLSQALWGTYAAHLKNMLKGVNELFEKKLVVEGIGYRSEISGTNLQFSIGYSHPVRLPIPAGITAKVEKNVITISGIDKDLVGAFAAEVRSVRKPEPYKGKGIRYDDEIIRRKQGKRAVA